jgi:uncharacterized membrane protein
LKILRLLLAVFFIAAGVSHFVSPGSYLAIMPASLPWPAALVFISGVAEIAGGAGVLFERTRRTAAVGLIILLVAVFPANVHAAQDGMNLSGWIVPPWVLWLRLPLQGVLIAWVYFVGWKDHKLPRCSLP